MFFSLLHNHVVVADTYATIFTAKLFFVEGDVLDGYIASNNKDTYSMSLLVD